MLLRRLMPALVACAAMTGVLLTPGMASAAVDQELPFPCAEQWTGTTRSTHSPSPRAVDFNRARDLGRITVASAAGVVTKVADTGSSSYGKWIGIDHGEGRSTVYAHLKVQWVVPGQFVDQGMPIGRVGDTGGLSGAHLHYEQRLGRDVEWPSFHQAPYEFGATTASLNCPDVPLSGDWDGDRSDEVAVFRRDAGAGTFRMYRPGAPAAVLRFGRGSDLPVTGDWDGDRVTDIGVLRSGTRAFILRMGDGSRVRHRMGRVGDLPVTGDWDGNGSTDLGIWRPAATRFRLTGPDGSHVVIVLGTRSSQPVAGDWDGNGLTDVGVYDGATASFTLRSVGSDGQVVLTTVATGSPGDLPVTGDWNGDGVTDVGTWSPSSATYALRVTPSDTAHPSSPAEPELRTLSFGRAR